MINIIRNRPTYWVAVDSRFGRFTGLWSDGGYRVLTGWARDRIASDEVWSSELARTLGEAWGSL